MAGASIQMGAAQVENLSEPKTWYDYVASAALTMASLSVCPSKLVSLIRGAYHFY